MSYNLHQEHSQRGTIAKAGLFILAGVLLLAIVVLYFQGRWTARPGSAEDELERITVRLPIPVVDTAFAPFYLGIDTGIFERHGLRVELEPGSPELNPVKMVEQGTDEFGVIGGPELLLTGRAAGARIKGVFLVHRNSNFVVILTHPSSGAAELSDLDGQRVGFFYGHISTDILHMLFRKAGIEVQEVDVGFDYSQFLAGRLAGQWAFRTTAGITLHQQGVEFGVIQPADYGIVTQGHVVITREDLAAERPGTVRKFVRALTEATGYAAEHPSESIAAAERRDPSFSAIVGEAQMEIYVPLMIAEPGVGWFPPDAIEQTKHQLVSVNLLESDFSLEGAYTNEFLPTRD